MRSLIESLCFLAGVGLIVYGFFLWSPALATVAGGVWLILFGFALRDVREDQAKPTAQTWAAE